MDKSVEITELKLKLGKKEVMLTIEEARKLKSALEEIFGKKVIREVEVHKHYDHYPWYPYKWYCDSTDWQELKQNMVYCSSDNSTQLMCKNSTAELSIKC